MEPTTKKRRLCDVNPPGDGEILLGSFRTTSSTNATATDVPPEIWARILEYSVFSDVACMALVSKSFLNDVMPRIRSLYLDNNVSCFTVEQARRFESVQEMVIDSLFCDFLDDSGCATFKVKHNWEDEGRSVVGDVLAFLPELKNVFLGKGTGESKTDILDRLHLAGGPETGYYHHSRDDITFEHCLFPASLRDSVLYRYMLRSLCGAYQDGRLSEDLAIHGLPADHYEINKHPVDCKICERLCLTFPLKQVAVFKRPELEEPYFPLRLGAPFSLVDTRVNFMAQRPGGIQLLKSKQTHFFRELLEHITFTSLVENNNEFVITHEPDILGAMRALKGLGFDPANVPHQVVMEALSREPDCSFRDPPKCRRIKESVFCALVELGFSLNAWDVTIVPDHRCSDVRYW